MTARSVSRLMLASQRGDNRIFHQWWRSWFGGILPTPQHAEHATMRGMLSAAEMSALRQASGDEFDRLYVDLMTKHHEGSIAMADEAFENAGDPRLILMAYALRHAQRGEISLMQGSEGVAAVKSAIGSLFEPLLPMRPL